MTTKEELKAKFATGAKPTGDDFAELIDGVVGPVGPKGEPGSKGADGKAFTYADFTPEQLAALKGEPGAAGRNGTNGTNGVGVKSLALTVNETGAVTGGTVTFTNDTTAAVTVTTA